MAAPAYSRQYATQPAITDREGRGSSRASVRVVRGARPASTPQAPSNMAFVAAIVAVILVVFTLLSFARVAISSHTIANSMLVRDITVEIENARSFGNKLEVDESLLVASANVKNRADKLGMTPAYGAGILSVEKDIVAMDSKGALSLTESVRRSSAAIQG